MKILAKDFVDKMEGARIYLVRAVEIEKPASNREAPTSAEPTQVPFQPAGFEQNFTTLLEAVKAWGQDNIFFQHATSGILGATSKLGDGYLVQVFQNANMSTILHETAHVFMLEMEAVVAAGAAHAQWTKDFQTLLKWVGAENAASKRGFSFCASFFRCPLSRHRHDPRE